MEPLAAAAWLDGLASQDLNGNNLNLAALDAPIHVQLSLAVFVADKISEIAGLNVSGLLNSVWRGEALDPRIGRRLLSHQFVQSLKFDTLWHQASMVEHHDGNTDCRRD